MLLTAYSLWETIHFNLEVPKHVLIATGVVQGLGLMFVPISTVAYSTLPTSSHTEAAGIFSLMRNIGSSVGISIVMTLLSRNTQINHAEIASRLSPFGGNMAHMPSTFGSSVSGLAELNGEVTRQAAAIAFLNDFWLMMVMTVVAIALLLLLRPVKITPTPTIVADH